MPAWTTVLQEETRLPFVKTAKQDLLIGGTKAKAKTTKLLQQRLLLLRSTSEDRMQSRESLLDVVEAAF